MKSTMSMTKNVDNFLAIWMTMGMRRYNLGRITQWSTSRALLEATVCHNQVSAWDISRPGSHHGH